MDVSNKNILGVLARVGACLVGLVFLASAYFKAIEPQQSIDAILWLVQPFSSIVAPIVYGLVTLELVLASLLIWGVFDKVASLVAMFLLVVFTAWVIHLHMVDAPVGCGCGLSASWMRQSETHWLAVIRNVAMMLMLTPRALLGRRTIWMMARSSERSLA